MLLALLATVKSVQIDTVAYGCRYYRIRDLQTGVVLRNITESCNHSFGSAFVDTDASGKSPYGSHCSQQTACPRSACSNVAQAILEIPIEQCPTLTSFGAQVQRRCGLSAARGGAPRLSSESNVEG